MSEQGFQGVYYWKNSEGVPKLYLGELTDRRLISAIEAAVTRVALLNPAIKSLTAYALRLHQALQEYVDENPNPTEPEQEGNKELQLIPDTPGSYL